MSFAFSFHVQQLGRPEAVAENLAFLKSMGYVPLDSGFHCMLRRLPFKKFYFIGRKESSANPIQLNKHLMGLDV